MTVKRKQFDDAITVEVGKAIVHRESIGGSITIKAHHVAGGYDNALTLREPTAIADLGNVLAALQEMFTELQKRGVRS